MEEQTMHYLLWAERTKISNLDLRTILLCVSQIKTTVT